MEPLVIDLSHHNTIPGRDLKATREAGVIGLIHKASEGRTVQDRKVDARAFLARDAGMLFGLYHFIRPGEISPQVRNFVEVYRRHENDTDNVLAALDYEDPGVSLDDCSDWLQQVEVEIGHRPVIYSGHVLKDKLGNRPHAFLNGANYPLWLAQYGPTARLPPGWNDYWLWQYTDKGTVAGVNPPTDLNAGEEARVRAVWGSEQKPTEEPDPGGDALERYRAALEDIRKRADEALGG